jgi:hypothetical protein
MNGVFLAVYLLVCTAPGNPATCTKLPITDSTQGQPDGSELTLTGCMGVQGAESARRYWDAHPDIQKHFYFGGWACQVGNKKAPDNGKA